MGFTIAKNKIIFYTWISLGFFLLFPLNAYFNYRETFFVRSVNAFWLSLYFAALNYIFYEYVLRNIKFNRKKILPSILIILAMVFLYSFGWFGFRYACILLHIYVPFITYPSVLTGVLNQSSYGVFTILIFGIAKHIYNYIQLRQSAQQLVIEKQQEELNYLKSQTNPHFLFNTLNNIYSLAQEKSDLAPESILRLSKILRYMLYETNVANIPLEQEWKIVTDYIALEKLRYDDSLNITVSYSLRDHEYQLPPLLLIPLVQNAFKHGVSETSAAPFLDVTLTVDEQQHMTFVVRNSTGKKTGPPENTKNIGLPNLRRQLELLYTDYDLILQRNDSEYTATLKINLASHVKNELYHH